MKIVLLWILAFLEQHPTNQYIHNSKFSNFDVNVFVNFF